MNAQQARREALEGVKRVVYGVKDDYPEEMDAVFDGIIYAMEVWENRATTPSAAAPADDDQRVR